MLTARVVCRELADLPGACLLPVCIVFSSNFRAQFCDIFGCRLLWSIKQTQQYRTNSQNHPESSNFHSHLSGFPNQTRESSRSSPKSFLPLSLHPQKQPEQFSMDASAGRQNSSSRPLWKWGQGWVMSQPSQDRNCPAQYAPVKRKMTPFEKVNYPTNKDIVSDQTRFLSCGLGLDQNVRHSAPHATYHQRAASVNDILYDPRLNMDYLPKSLPRVHNTAEWFEPRSYV